MSSIKFSEGKTIVSGDAKTGKTLYLQKIASQLWLQQKVVVGYIDKNVEWEKIENIHSLYLEDGVQETGFELREQMPIFLSRFIKNTLEENSICIIDGFSKYESNFRILNQIIQMEGTLIFTLQHIWLHAPNEILEAVKWVDRIVELWKASKYLNKEIYQKLGIQSHKIIFLND